MTTDPITDPATQYARDVVERRLVAGPHVRNAARRHLLDLDTGSERGLTWDLPAAMWAIEFFPGVLRLSQSFDGEPFDLQPAQKFIIGSLFGWKLGKVRRFRRAYIEMGKGGGKSPLAAGIGMYMLLADHEAQAEVYAVASIKTQAMVIFRSAVAMWRQSPALTSRLTPSGGNPIWNLADLKTGSFFRPVSSDEGLISGPMPSCALCDEIHEHRNGDAVEMMERGFKSRKQPLLLMITNSGTDRNSVCWNEHLHAVRVAAGSREAEKDSTFVGETIDDRAFSFVCSLDEGDDPLEDESCWVKANPLLGVTMPISELRTAVAQAKAIPGKLNGILRLHFCEWTDAETAWMSRQSLESVLTDFDPLEHAGEEISIGADIGATRDMTALGFVVQTGTVELSRDDGTVATLPTYRAWVEAWTPKDTIRERALQDRAPYDVWVEQGYLNATAGSVVRLDFVAARVSEVQADYKIRALGYDSYAFRRNFEPELDQMGVTCPLVEHPQGGKRRAAPTDEQKAAAQAEGKDAEGLWMPGSLNALETLILEHRIEIMRNPVMISAAMSAAIERDPFDNRWFSKRKAANRIDALVALTMAVGVAVAGEGVRFGVDDFLMNPVMG